MVLLVLEELERGDFLAWPFADPELVAHGQSRDEVVEQQELFLREHLAKQPGERLASFDPHGDARIELVEVPLQREGLPDRVRLDQPLVFPCLLVPDANAPDDLWAVVLTLRHAIWIPGGAADEALRTRKIRDEIARIVAARELDGRAFLELLRGGDPFTLERLQLEVDREERAGAEARAAARRRRARERSQAEARALLGRIGSSLVEEVRRHRPAPILHREREIASLDALLRGPERLALMLVGPELAGKTAVVHGLVDRWLHGGGRLASPPEIVATSGAQLVAGQSGFGQLEQRVRDVMAAAEAVDAILYFDNLADLFARTSGELGDVAANVRPWIERGRVRLLGEISPEALDHHEKRHVGFFAYLNRIAVEALDARQTHAILTARARHDGKAEPERPTLALPAAEALGQPGARSHDAVTPLVDLADRYFNYQAFPGKALRFYAALRASQDSAGERDEDGRPKPIGPEQVYRGFSIHSGIPMFLLREDRSLDHRRIVEFFQARVIGQHEAIGRIAETLCTVKAGLQPAHKPLATFLFVGPTGVGKTEIAKTLARFLFGSPERLVRFDMSEYMDPLAAERLIRGSDRDDGVLTRRVRQQPFCVVLLDEIEKAHPAVFDLLLQVCGEGRLSDARGRTTWFHNAIIIMTSNLGAAHARRASSGFASATASRGPDASASLEAERYYLEQVDTHFRPEFVNRIDRVIPFHPLDRAQIAAVAEVSLARVRERDGVAGRGITLEVAAPTLERLAREGYSDHYGARALRRELEDRLVSPLARTLAALADASEGASVRVREAHDPAATTDAAGSGPAKPEPGTRVLASEQHEGLATTVTVPTSRTTRRTLDALTRVSSLRRSAAAAVQLEPIRELRDRVKVLIAELGYGAHRKQGQRSAWEHSAELGRLQAEYGRIAETVAKIDELHDSIASAEELIIAALQEGEPAQIYQELAEDSYQSLRVTLVDALLLGDERHAITIHLQEQDPRGALLPYLLPLLDHADARGWRLSFHVFGDEQPSELRWPPDRAWGPPRPPHWLRQQLLGELEPDPATGKLEPRKFRDVLMCVSGRHAGALLGLQLGLFRYDAIHLDERKRSGQRPSHLRLRFVSPRAEILPSEWSQDRLQIPKPIAPNELDAWAKVAHFDEQGRLDGKLVAGSPVALTPAQLWPELDALLFPLLVLRTAQGDPLGLAEDDGLDARDDGGSR